QGLTPPIGVRRATGINEVDRDGGAMGRSRDSIHGGQKLLAAAAFRSQQALADDDERLAAGRGRAKLVGERVQTRYHNLHARRVDAGRSAGHEISFVGVTWLVVAAASGKAGDAAARRFAIGR